MADGSTETTAKLGWDYFWVSSAPVPTADDSKMFLGPIAVHVQTVYDETDFDALEIPA